MRRTLVFLLFTGLAACQVNPVTGERNLQFYGSDWEQQVGAQMYAPMRQAEGGDYRLDPGLTAYVQEVGLRVAAQARRDEELHFEFHVLNDSTPNAWALPGGKIAINRGLLTELNSEAELAAVLGHEVVHADAAHGARAQSKGMLTQIGAIAGMVLIESTVDSSAGRQAAGMVPVLGAQLLNTKYGRDAEREADRYGMEYMSEAGYDPQGAVQLQETFVRLSEGRRQDWLSGLFASHPPSRERVELNRQTAARLPAGGETGAQSYRDQLAYLRRVKPAYQAYDRAMEAAREEHFDSARSEVEKALDLEPKEALFHALKGDLQDQAGRHSDALRSFNRAVELDSRFYYHSLRRGQLRYALDRMPGARSDLERSIELLPTPQAHYLLGQLERRAGQSGAARRHYEHAAQSDSAAGAKAQRELILMDIDTEPGKYVATGQAAGQDGTLYCLIGNRTRVDLRDIQVATVFIDDAGRTLRDRKRFNDVLPAGKQSSIATGWRTQDAANLQNRMQCTVEHASLVDG